MPRKAAGTNGKAKNKMEVVRNILTANPKLSPSEISDVATRDHGVDIDMKLAKNYKFKILRGKKKGKRRKGGRVGRPPAAASAAATAAPKAVAMAAPRAAAGAPQAGVDDLLRAAQQLGWKRVQEIVEGVIQAPK